MFVEASICRLVSRFTYGTQNYCQSDWSFLFLPTWELGLEACSEDVFNFSRKLMIPIVLFQSLWTFFFMAGVHQQPDQSNYLAEGQTCKLLRHALNGWMWAGLKNCLKCAISQGCRIPPLWYAAYHLWVPQLLGIKVTFRSWSACVVSNSQFLSAVGHCCLGNSV